MDTETTVEYEPSYPLENFLRKCRSESCDTLDLIITNRVDEATSKYINIVNYFLFAAAKESVSEVQSRLIRPESKLCMSAYFDKQDPSYEFEMDPIRGSDEQMVPRWSLIGKYGKSVQETCLKVGFTTSLTMTLKARSDPSFYSGYIEGHHGGNVELLDLPILTPGSLILPRS
jgi:hypothetical protein